MALTLGIEEAGRGPVIGPLVVVGLLVDSKDEQRLKNIGAKDSKMLTPRQREGLYETILKISKSRKIFIISPKEIDDAVNGKEGLNLNWLEAQKAVEAIDELKPNEVQIDCPSNNIKAFVSYIESRTLHKCKIVAEHKADAKYPVVSAASIIAKVTRDREIKKIEEMIGQRIGSGYPADPVTQEFLKQDHRKNPEIYRKSWATYKDMVNTKKQKKLGEF
ncbi:MAG: ribonuclease HII [Candidatus Woesearchaeota archaeon]